MNTRRAPDKPELFTYQNGNKVILFPHVMPESGKVVKRAIAIPRKTGEAVFEEFLKLWREGNTNGLDIARRLKLKSLAEQSHGHRDRKVAEKRQARDAAKLNGHTPNLPALAPQHAEGEEETAHERKKRQAREYYHNNKHKVREQKQGQQNGLEDRDRELIRTAMQAITTGLQNMASAVKMLSIVLGDQRGD